MTRISRSGGVSSPQRRMELVPTFLLDEGMSRRGVAGDQAIDQQPGRVIGAGEGVLLATDAPPFRPQMPSMHRRHPLRGQPVQPWIERQRPIAHSLPASAMHRSGSPARCRRHRGATRLSNPDAGRPCAATALDIAPTGFPVPWHFPRPRRQAAIPYRYSREGSKPLNEATSLYPAKRVGTVTRFLQKTARRTSQLGCMQHVKKRDIQKNDAILVTFPFDS